MRVEPQPRFSERDLATSLTIPAMMFSYELSVAECKSYLPPFDASECRATPSLSSWKAEEHPEGHRYYTKFTDVGIRVWSKFHATLTETLTEH